MSLQDLLRVFEERFYQWALRDLQREIEQDFPFLRRIADSLSKRVIAIMKSLPREEQLRLATTLVRRNLYGWITPPPPQEWTPEDERILVWYFDRIGQPTNWELEMGRKQGVGEVNCRIDKQKLLRVIQDTLAGLFPDPLPKKRFGALRYRTHMHGFDVETVIEAGTRGWQLSFYHRIRNDRLGFDVDRISIHRWLGIASVTYWWYITDAEIPATAQLVRDLCCHFLESAKTLCQEGEPPGEQLEQFGRAPGDRRAPGAPGAPGDSLLK